MTTVRWPTVVLAVVCVGVVVVDVAGVFGGAVDPVVAVVVSAVAAYAGFTAVHDAAHKAVSSVVVVNEAVGHVAALLLLGPFLPYRFLHLAHHRHTNVVGADPDRFCGGPRWSLPLRWLSQDVAYLWFFAKHWRSRPVEEVVDLVVVGGVLVVAAAVAGVNGADGVVALVCGWWLPARLALFALAFSFDWLPHAPHVEVDRFKATVVRSGRLWTVLLLGQNFHLVHHLDPAAPFFALPRLWRERRDALLAHGAVDRSAEVGSRS